MEGCLHAYDWIVLAAQVREQLAGAQAKLAEAKREREQGWLAEAQEVLAKDLEAREELMARARQLPELASVREEHAADLIGPWADAVERLHAGIVFHAGLKSPIIEALFPHRKFDSLRRGNLENAQIYGAEFHRRLASSYIERLLAREEFAFAKPSVDEVMSRYHALSPQQDEALGQENTEQLTAELIAHAQEIELALKQARLLAEAALAPLAGAFQELGIKSKPKTRGAAKAKKVEDIEEVSETPAPAIEEEKPAPKKKKEAKAKAAPAKAAPAKAAPAKVNGKATKKRKASPEASA